MTIKATFHFLSARYTPSETHYNNLFSTPGLAIPACVAYAALRVPCLGNFAGLIAITISTVPASRLVDSVDSSLWAAAPTWPADPTGDVYSADRPYSSLLVRMAGGGSIRNWWMALCPDALLQTPGQGNAPGVSFASAPAFGARYGAFMNYLINPANGWGFMTRTNDFPITALGLATNAGFPGLIGVQTAAPLILTTPPTPAGVGSRVNITGYRRVNPRQTGLSGLYKVAGIVGPVAPATTPYLYLLAGTQGVALSNVSGIGSIAPLDMTFQSYFSFDTIRATGKKRGGRYGLSAGKSLRR